MFKNKFELSFLKYLKFIPDLPKWTLKMFIITQRSIKTYEHSLCISYKMVQSNRTQR